MRCLFELSKAGMEVGSQWIKRPGLKPEGQRKGWVGMGCEVKTGS